MRDFLVRNMQFILMLMVWVASGMAGTPVAMGVVAVSILLLKRKNYYAELILGFMFILILSDSRQDLFEFAKKVKEIYLVLLTVFYLFDKKSFRFNNTFVLPFIPFLIWSFAMAFRSPDMEVAIQKTLSYGLLYFVIPAYFIKGFRTIGPVFLKDFIMLITGLFVIGILLTVLNPGFVFLAGRFSSILGNPNAMGIYGFLFIVFTVCTQTKFPDLFTRNELISIYVIVMVSVIMSGSRNALICIFMFLAFLKFYKISYWWGFMTVIIAIMLYQVVFANIPTILEMLGLAKALRADTLESGSGRMIAWLFALKQLNSDLSLFIMGRGFSYDEYLYYINMDQLSALGHQGGVHNTYLALWLNTGIVGLVLWAVGFFRTIFRAVAISHAALPLMYASMFSAFYEAWLMGSLNPFHITFLFIITLVTTDNRDFAGTTENAAVAVPENLVQNPDNSSYGVR